MRRRLAAALIVPALMLTAACGGGGDSAKKKDASASPSDSGVAARRSQAGVRRLADAHRRGRPGQEAHDHHPQGRPEREVRRQDADRGHRPRGQEGRPRGHEVHREDLEERQGPRRFLRPGRRAPGHPGGLADVHPGVQRGGARPEGRQPRPGRRPAGRRVRRRGQAGARRRAGTDTLVFVARHRQRDAEEGRGHPGRASRPTCRRSRRTRTRPPRSPSRRTTRRRSSSTRSSSRARAPRSRAARPSTCSTAEPPGSRTRACRRRSCSTPPGRPAPRSRPSIGQGQVIEGWDKGLVGKKVGSRVLLVIPPEQGYKDKAQGADIPANSTLVFVVDILGAV